MKVHTKSEYRKRRHFRIRKKVQGTAARPRMSVYLSNKHIYVQFIDDVGQATLAAASTALKGASGKANGKDAAQEVGRLAAEAVKAKGVSEVVFDRSGFRYGGKMKALADAAREAGLKF